MESDIGVPRAFRAHFARHNREALLTALVSLAGAAAVWTVLYLVGYWLALLVLSSTAGVDATAPKGFPKLFVICALALCLLSWISQRIWPNYFPKDQKKSFENFMDILLAAPRLTLAVWGNLSARISLSPWEMEEAWHLLQVVGREKRFNISQLPLEVPNRSVRSKIVFALQLVGLIELHRDTEEAWFVLQGDKARALCSLRKLETSEKVTLRPSLK